MEYLLLFLLPVPPLALTYFSSRNRSSSGRIELGVVFSWIVFFYSWFPLLGIVLAESGYGFISDQRFVNNPPFPGEVASVGLYYLSFLVGFSFLYLLVRRKESFVTIFVRPGSSQIVAVLGIFAALSLINIVLTSFFGVNEGGDYAGSYTAFRTLPYFMQQIMGVLNQLQFTTVVMVIVYVLIWKPHLHVFVAITIAFIVLETILFGGSRSIAFLSAFAYIVCYSISVGRIKAGKFAGLIGLGVVLFALSGLLRSGGDVNEFSFLTPFQKGELLSVFFNSLDLLRRVNETGQMPFNWSIYFLDLIRVVPQQLLWFEKTDLAVWYVSTYYPSFYESGGGLAFGAISESVIGFGAIEAFLRGCALGIGFSCVTNYCFSGRVGILKVVTYVWFVVISYQSVRDTTFTVFARYFLHVLPLIICLVLVRKMIVINKLTKFTKPQNLELKKSE